MGNGRFVPGRNAFPDVLALKQEHIRDPHVAPFNALADRIADAEGIARGLVPYVDPQLGGTGARILALLDNPSTKATAGSGSGLLSLENDDRSAKNCAALYNEFGLGPELFVHWNAAPAPIAGTANGGSSVLERKLGAKWLREVVALLPNLEVVLLMGRNAEDGWRRAGLRLGDILIPADVPHPSQRGLNSRDGRMRFRRALELTSERLRAQAPRRRAIETDLEEQGQQGAPSIECTPAGASSNSASKWGWWPTLEHFCVPDSVPWGVSVRLDRVESAIDSHLGQSGKSCAIGRLDGNKWVLVARRRGGSTTRFKIDQAQRYEKARAGGSRGNLGPSPALSEQPGSTLNLDNC